MRFPVALILPAALLAVAATARRAEAQGTRYVTCESGGDIKRCYVQNVDQYTITVDRQLSRAACTRESSWGTDTRGIWVSDGCRARFRAEPNNAGGNGGGGVNEITCESPGRQITCTIPDLRVTSVHVIRRLSDAQCTQDFSWGVLPTGIWVSRGCRAVFGYQQLNAGNGGGNGNGNGRRTITCESRGGPLQNCRVFNLNEQSVRMERQLSDAPCVNGQTWGTMPDMIWVESGCRATFSYTTGFGNGNGGNQRLTITCESKGGPLQNCRVPGLDESTVLLTRQLSDSPCVKGRTWGTQRNIIWVESGCRATFSYRRN